MTQCHEDMYTCLRGTARCYLQDVIQPVAEVKSRRRLRGLHRHPLLWCQQHVVQRYRVRAFAVAGPRAWNILPEFFTDCSSLLTSRLIYLVTFKEQKLTV